MLRYAILAWDKANASQRQTASLLASRLKAASAQWRTTLLTDHLHVLCLCEQPNDESECQLLPQQGGVLLGTVFRRIGESLDPTIAARASIDTAEAELIARSAGRHLVDHYWGSYVAVLRDSQQERTWLLRSPLGSLPCLTVQFRGVRMFFSFMPDCASLGLIDLTVNWRYVARYLAKFRIVEETGINEVDEVAGGECLEIHGAGTSSHIYWNALDVAASDAIEDAVQARTALRDTVKACVHSWASCHRHVLLRLSGGLDSSILLTSLNDAPSHPRITCVNRYSTGANADEREFARLAARHAKQELVELPRNPLFRMEDMLHAQLSETPVNYVMQFGQHRQEAGIAREHGADAIFAGTYGDQVFYASEPRLTVADYIHRHGLRPALFEIALNAAHMQGRTLWWVLREAFTKGALRHRWDPLAAFRPANTLLNEECIRSMRGPETREFPWYRPDRYVPPGKQFHLYSVMNPDAHYKAFENGGNVRFTSPLLSQPIVELCLRIPTYLLLRNGWNRDLARDAFAADLPPEIARRRSKGGQQDYTLELYRRNMGFIRQLLLDGELVRRGLLDRRNLEEALSGRPTGVLPGMSKITHCLNIEMWVGAWCNRKERAAA